jgi:hypothetical protein
MVLSNPGTHGKRLAGAYQPGTFGGLSYRGNPQQVRKVFSSIDQEPIAADFGRHSSGSININRRSGSQDILGRVEEE